MHIMLSAIRFRYPLYNKNTCDTQRWRTCLSRSLHDTPSCQQFQGDMPLATTCRLYTRNQIWDPHKPPRIAATYTRALVAALSCSSALAATSRAACTCCSAASTVASATRTISSAGPDCRRAWTVSLSKSLDSHHSPSASRPSPCIRPAVAQHKHKRVRGF